MPTVSRSACSRASRSAPRCRLARRFTAAVVEHRSARRAVRQPECLRALLTRAEERALHGEPPSQPGPVRRARGRQNHQRPSCVDARHLSRSADAPGFGTSRHTQDLHASGGSSFAGSQAAQALTGFVKWPDQSTLPQDAPDPDDPRAFVHYKLTPVSAYQIRQTDQPATQSFRFGLRTFDQDLPVRGVAETTLHVQPAILPRSDTIRMRRIPRNLRPGRTGGSIGCAPRRRRRAPRNLTLGHRQPRHHVNQVLDATLRSPDLTAAPAAASLMATSANGRVLFVAFGRRGLARIC